MASSRKKSDNLSADQFIKNNMRSIQTWDSLLHTTEPMELDHPPQLGGGEAGPQGLTTPPPSLTMVQLPTPTATPPSLGPLGSPTTPASDSEDEAVTAVMVEAEATPPGARTSLLRKLQEGRPHAGSVQSTGQKDATETRTGQQAWQWWRQRQRRTKQMAQGIGCGQGHGSRHPIHASQR